MRFKVLNGPGGARAPWRGTLALSALSAPSPHSDQPADERAVAPWLLMNLTGQVASRLDGEGALHSLHGLRSLPGGPGQPVLLTDAQIDQVAGLISLRGGAPIDLYATPAVFEDLTSTLPVLPELERHCGVHWHIVPVAGDRRAASFQVRGQEGLEFVAFDTGPAPEGCVGNPVAPQPGHSIAVGVRDLASGRRAVFARGLGVMALSELGVLDGAACLLVDPGLAPDAEAQGQADMLLDWLAELPVPRKVLLGTHTAALAGRGIEVALDGADIVV